MPGFDRTGPRGLGPMTGRGLGTCSPEGIVKEDGKIPEGTPVIYGVGRGGRPRGCGRGRCGGFGGRRQGRW